MNGFTYNSPLLYDRNVFSFVALNGIREYASAANANLEIDTSGRLKAIYDRARANREVADTNVVISERDLALNVSVAYYRVLLTTRLQTSAEENARAAHDFEAKVQDLVNGGEASRAELARASAESAMLDRTAESLKIEAERASHDLVSYWTTDVTAGLALTDDLDQQFAAPVALSSDTAYLRRPEFQLFTAQIKGLNADARAARAGMLPQLNLSFQYGFDTTQLESQDRGYAGFVHLNIPVFDFLRAYSEKRQFESQAMAARTDAVIGKRLFSREYQDSLSQVNGTYLQLATTQKEVDAAKESLRLSRLRFEGGEGSALEVVTAQSALVQAEIDFYSTRADYLNAQAALKVASGQ